MNKRQACKWKSFNVGASPTPLSTKSKYENVSKLASVKDVKRLLRLAVNAENKVALDEFYLCGRNGATCCLLYYRGFNHLLWKNYSRYSKHTHIKRFRISPSSRCTLQMWRFTAPDKWKVASTLKIIFPAKSPQFNLKPNGQTVLFYPLLKINPELQATIQRERRRDRGARFCPLKVVGATFPSSYLAKT